MERLFLVCLGGAIGSGARYLVSIGMLTALGPSFPFGTLTVNVIGSFLLAVIMQAAKANDAISANVFLTLTTGLMGGFTTYSTFNYETFRLLQDGAWLSGGLYLGLTVIGCLLACALGLAAARALFGA